MAPGAVENLILRNTGNSLDSDGCASFAGKYVTAGTIMINPQHRVYVLDVEPSHAILSVYMIQLAVSETDLVVMR